VSRHSAGGGGEAETRPDSSSLTESALAPLVPEDGLFEGQVAVVGQTLIEGTVQGSLRGPGELIVGARARIEGPIECADLDSRGRINGPVVVRTRARLASGARFEGDMVAQTVEVDDNAVWNGLARVGPIAEQD